MTVSRVAITFAVQVASRQFLSGIILVAAAGVLIPTVHARAQQAQSPLQGRVIVIGEGSVGVTPDYALTTGGVTNRAKTVKEATDANSKLMAAITTALLEFSIVSSRRE